MSTGRKQPTPCPTASHLKGLELLGMKVKEVSTLLRFPGRIFVDHS